MEKFFWWIVLLVVVTVTYSVYLTYLAVKRTLEKKGHVYKDGRNVVWEEIIVWSLALIFATGAHIGAGYDRVIKLVNKIRDTRAKKRTPSSVSMANRDDFADRI